MEGGGEKEEREERGERGGEGGREENGEKEELWDSQPACQAELSLPLAGLQFLHLGVKKDGPEQSESPFLTKFYQPLTHCPCQPAHWVANFGSSHLLALLQSHKMQFYFASRLWLQGQANVPDG